MSSVSRVRVPIILATLFGLLSFAAPAAAQPPHLEVWHRLNPDTADVAPEHERLLCLPGTQWVCRYDKVPEPDFHWDRTIAMFHGRQVADPECVEWLEAICGEDPVIIAGVATYVLAGGGAFRTGHELIFTDAEGVAPLYIHWTDAGFACPWYGSFQDALDANPTIDDDCEFAP